MDREDLESYSKSRYPPPYITLYTGRKGRALRIRLKSSRLTLKWSTYPQPKTSRARSASSSVTDLGIGLRTCSLKRRVADGTGARALRRMAPTMTHFARRFLRHASRRKMPESRPAPTTNTRNSMETSIILCAFISFVLSHCGLALQTQSLATYCGAYSVGFDAMNGSLSTELQCTVILYRLHHIESSWNFGNAMPSRKMALEQCKVAGAKLNTVSSDCRSH